ncbi:hypothetical protein KUTeg_017860 [Tegillarca granosa]|uniref:Ig-like domain-containing protein n=1 Tax=Tegillarca granosa TaxID=220873 RepID=A0ABQ9EK12_TEGGR|nr:hypothetical protein KUTeg_017860 [Tegillarca granosa]
MIPNKFKLRPKDIHSLMWLGSDKLISKKTDHFPRRIHTSTDVVVTQGQTAILPCKTNEENHEDLMIIWMNPKKILISQKESRFIDDTRMSIERPFLGDWNLHVRHVQYKDKGVYTCTINSYPVFVRHINLTVQVPSRIIDSSSTSNVRVREGETVKLNTWEIIHDIHDMINYFTEVGNVGEELIIRNISRYCGGTYLCQAYNDVPPAVSRPIKVEVQCE